MNDQNEILKSENRQLSDKVVEIMRIESEKLENEVSAHFETKNRVKVAENRNQTLNYEIENYEQ